MSSIVTLVPISQTTRRHFLDAFNSYVIRI